VTCSMYRIKWDVHVHILSENLKGGDKLGGIYVSDRKTLKLILRKCGVRMWTGLNWPNTGSNYGFREHSNEVSVSMKTGKVSTSSATVKFSRKVLLFGVNSKRSHIVGQGVLGCV
jgi:hypothetical protein